MGKVLTDIEANISNSKTASLKACQNAILNIYYNAIPTMVGAPQTFQAVFSLPCSATQKTNVNNIHGLMSNLIGTYGFTPSGYVYDIPNKKYYSIAALWDVTFNQVKYIASDNTLHSIVLMNTTDYINFSWTIDEMYVKTQLVIF